MRTIWHKRDEAPPKGSRILAFSPCHPVGHEMRFRVMGGEWLERSSDVELWADCESILV